MSETITPLESIRAFVHVAQAGSFTKAAQALEIPKSTLSRWITDLEAQLGTQLLHRTTRKLSLTEAGLAYFARTERAISELEDASRAVAALEIVPRGTLRVTAPVDLAGRAMAPLYSRFITTYPDVKLVVIATNRQVDLVAERVDLALRAGTLQDSSLLSRKLSSGFSSLFSSEAYLKEHGSPKELDDLVRHRCLMFGSSNDGTWRLRRGSQEKELLISGALAATDFGVLIEACAAGAGVGLLPASLVQPPDCRRGLVPLFPDWRAPGGDLHAVYPSTEHLSAKVRAFIDMSAEHFATTTNLSSERISKTPRVGT